MGAALTSPAARLRTAPTGTGSVQYSRLDRRQLHSEPVPYRHDLAKRFLTYHVALGLGLLLYLFVYYVLVKRQSFGVLTAGFLLLLAYLLVVESSHSLRSVLMLCLPIMFTNRGRALVFCCMLALLLEGPVRNSQLNVAELHLSLSCCRQYLIVRADEQLGQPALVHVIAAEETLKSLVGALQRFADEIKQRFRTIIQLAITVERYIVAAIERLKEIVNICNKHARDTHRHCYDSFKRAHLDCKARLGAKLGLVCAIVEPLKELCSLLKLPELLCEIPRAVVQFLDRTVGEKLRHYMRVIENELYVDIRIEHHYFYNGTKTKSFKRVANEIKFDVKRKFWYVQLICRTFNLVSLILVCWILATATLYHMHYLGELGYDNMYLDERLRKIERARKLKAASNKAAVAVYLFPMRPAQERKYMQPASCRMNEAERSKLCTASLVWLLICGYISFFLLLDYSLFQLLQLITDLLREILFSSELPLLDVSARSGHEVVHYNRTYLSYLRARQREQLQLEAVPVNSSQLQRAGLSGMYLRLINSIRESVPDEVAILDSLEQCLPRANQPDLALYRRILYLAGLTFMGVLLEAYALRLRHCIAGLFYPVRANRRAAWLYQRLLRVRLLYEEADQLRARRQLAEP